MSLYYLANPNYGGWVSFTAHLALKHNLDVYKVCKINEKRTREFGYGVVYKNINSVNQSGVKIITALDKHHYHLCSLFPDNTSLVIHDPTELKQIPLEILKRFDIITIRQSVKDFLFNNYSIQSRFLVHPFYPYITTKQSNPTRAVSISRVDYDKHTDIILGANNPLPIVDIYGFVNRMYLHHKLDAELFTKSYKGSFKKDFNALNNILQDVKFVVDLSVIKNDGGGSQYTFLEAIHQDCILILHKNWLSKDSIFIDGYNCIAVSNSNELKEALNRIDVGDILINSKKLLEPHLEIVWCGWCG